jgi:single-stranded-DNA-specific exonuclease
VALGTVADVVPLLGENRIFARHGLAMLKDTTNPGLIALMESSRLTGVNVSGYDVGFKLAPRLNAAGRMGHARLAVELLTRADAARAREIAEYLEKQNRSRQTEERKIYLDACQKIEQHRLDGDACRGIVLASEEWHAGVIGIVASRVVERFGRPTVLIAVDKGVGQGSARSIPPFSMNEALAACGEHLLQFGGHAMAAGLRIDAARIPQFSEAFVRHANNRLSGADIRPKLRLDGEVGLGDLDLGCVGAMLNLGPFGQGNPAPKFATSWVDLEGEPRRMGKNGEHLSAVFRDGGARLRCVAFGRAAAESPLKDARRCRIAFEPTINEFNGNRTVEVHALDFQFHGTDVASA